MQALDLEAKLTSSAKQGEALQQRAAELEAEVGAAAGCCRLALLGKLLLLLQPALARVLQASTLFGSPSLLPCPLALIPLSALLAPTPPLTCSSRPPSSSSTSCRERTPR